MNKFNIKHGFISKGDSIVNGILSASTLNLTTQPSLNGSPTEVLVRNTTTGEIEYAQSSQVGSSGDTYVTGVTLNGDSLELGRNEGLPTLSVSLSGFSDNTDNFVTGATLVGNTLVLSRTDQLSGATVDLSQFLDNTDTNDFVTGGTMVGSTLVLNRTDQLSGATIDLSQFLDNTNSYVTGFTYNDNNILTLGRNGGLTDISTSINIMSGLTITGDLNVGSQLTLYPNDGVTDPSISYSGVSASTITLQVQPDGSLVWEGDNGSLFSIVDDKSGILWAVSDVSGNDIGYIDADWLVQFGNPFDRPFKIEYNSGDGSSDITMNADILIPTGNTLTIPEGAVSGYVLGTDGSGNVSWIDVDSVVTTGDTYVSGTSFNISTYELTIDLNNGTTYSEDLSVLADDVYVLSGIYTPSTGIVEYTNSSGGTFQVNGFTTGMTDSYTTTATTSGSEIQFDNNIQGSNLYSVDLSPMLDLKTDLTDFVSHTGDTTIHFTADSLDSRFVNLTGDTVTGSLNVSDTLSACTIITDTISACTSNINLSPSGNVGVKTSSPAFDLEVNGSFGATSKSFVIDHPTKKGKRLIHGAIEGPEFGVYVRGEVQSKVIELPEYWTGLVDETTITVQLTSIGGSQNLYVEKIEDNKVFINTSGWFSTPHCYYTVYGERKDIDKIVIEK